MRPSGTVARSMAVSLQRTLLLGLLGWHVVMVLVVVAAPTRLPTAAIAAVHLLAVAGTLAALRGRVPYVALLIGTYPVWLLDYLAARTVDDAIALAACWLGNLLYLASALGSVDRSRTWVPVLGSVAVVAALVLDDGIWTFPVASAFTVTAVVVAGVVRTAMPSLWSLADTADRYRQDLETQRAARLAGRMAGVEAAEDARVLHDTVINTLAAIAAGGGGDEERDLRIRDRCRQDLETARTLLERRPRGTARLRDVAVTEEPISVTRIGPDDAALDRLQESLPPGVAAALGGAVGEALRNVSKHAQVPEARVVISLSAEEVAIEVTDAGLGFDPARVARGSGLLESIGRRMAAVGGEAQVLSRPGEGTRVRISYRLVGSEGPSAEPEAGPDPTPECVAEDLVRRACWLLGGGIVAVGVLIEAANRPGRVTWTYAMLLLVGLGLLAAWRSARRYGRVSPRAVALLVVLLPLASLAALAGVDLGRSEVIYLQAIGVAPLLMVLVLAAPRRAVAVAVGLHLATALTVAAVVGRDDVQYAAVVLVGTAPSLLLALAWWGFTRLVRRIVTESEQVRALAAATEHETLVEREVAEGRRVWEVAGLERTVDLLERLATGQARPDDAEVRAACAAEETYLRQLLLLSPSAYRLGVWFARALAQARRRGVDLVLRCGDHDAADRLEAARVGGLVLRAVDLAPPGGSLTVSWFLTQGQAHLFLVGPRGVLTGDDDAGDAGPTDLEQLVPAGWPHEFRAVGEQEFLEVRVPTVPTGPAAAGDGTATWRMEPALPGR